MPVMETDRILARREVVECLEFFTKHPMVEIRNEATTLLQVWKKSPTPSEIHNSMTMKPELDDRQKIATTACNVAGNRKLRIKIKFKKLEPINQESVAIPLASESNIVVDHQTKLKETAYVPPKQKPMPAIMKTTGDPEFTRAANVLNRLESYKGKKSPPRSGVKSQERVIPKADPKVIIHAKRKTNLIKKKAEEAPKQNTCDLNGKLREHLLEALSKVATEAQDETTKAKVNSCDVVRIADLIESAMLKKIGERNAKNMGKYRSILFNLRDPNNPELRRRVVVGEISPEKLMEMTTEEMASGKRKRENEEIWLKSLFRHESVKEDEETTEKFKCEKCGQRKCTYYQMQTRSADEPMTTFVRCVVCCNRWKF